MFRQARSALTVGLALGGGACGGEAGPAVIGYAFPEGGRSAVEVARAAFAADSAWAGPSITIVYDSIGTTDPADVEVRRARELAALPGVVAVVGHGGSRGSLAAAPVYDEAGIPNIVPTSTSRLLAGRGRWSFLLADNDSIEGAFLADFVVARFQPRTVVVFYANDEYGVGLRDGVLASLVPRGVVVLDQVPVDQGSDADLLVAASLQRGRPDVVVSAARWLFTARMARAYHQRGHRVPVVAGDGVLPMERMVARAGDAADSLYAVTFWSPQDTSAASRAYVERFGQLEDGRLPSGSDAMSHDGLMLVAAAIREVGTDREAIRAWLASLGVSRPPYQGVTGPITFRPDRPSRFSMIRLMGGATVKVDP